MKSVCDSTLNSNLYSIRPRNWIRYIDPESVQKHPCEVITVDNLKNKTE